MPQISETGAQDRPAISGAHGSPANKESRPFRFKVRGSILGLLRLPNRRMLRTRLHQISVSGGLLNVDDPLEEKLRLELVFNLQETTIRETVEMMFPMWATQGWLQPFRFIDMPEANKNTLAGNLRALLHSGGGPAPS
jgi:hypothetical protein